jgi:hypothetical protein
MEDQRDFGWMLGWVTSLFVLLFLGFLIFLFNQIFVLRKWELGRMILGFGVLSGEGASLLGKRSCL